MGQSLKSRAAKPSLFSKAAIATVLLWLSNISAGLALTTGLAILTFFLRMLPGLNLLSPAILAILLGILLRNTVGVPQIYQPGITLSLKRILKLAIILLGFQLSLPQAMAIGPVGLAIVVTTLISTFYFTCWMGQRLRVNKNLTYLIAAGTSICGASAIVATSAAIKSSDEDTSYAVALITLFGTASMLIYPVLMPLLQLTPEAFGIWCGASIHEVAQAIAAAFQVNSLSGEIASVSKLSRVLLLAPMIMAIATIPFDSRGLRSNSNTYKLAIPWFILYFIALIILTSLNVFPVGFKASVVQANQFFLTIAMVAMGLETRVQNVKKIGLKPLVLGALSWLFISNMSFILVSFWQYFNQYSIAS